ncbi:hypothetical protein EDC14_1005209 [Hydrogenispora ethanolica]|jgi:hypothetical protein|uniref:Uncharacterized protein n=1 Tax=Hydrogenispora ethanolica TaxID=1082276 RepID=A0A4R1S2D2_HYDET|nr:hypothetical protein [Hydrogenispora ethanolica]TCL73345.1 hypothetical protein EDC14_1005209 [Hydrogenispora ethanolica]
MSFEIGTVIVVGIIFGLFFYGAHQADKAVAAKAEAKRRAQAKTASRH